MSLTHQDRLQVLGLWPTWRLRAPAGVEPETALVVAPEAPIGTESAFVVAAMPVMPPPAQSGLASDSRYQQPSSRRLKPAATPPVEMPELPPAQPVIPVTKGDVRPLGDMDWPTLTHAILACNRCELAKTRTHAVPGVGDPHAEWLFIGEAPGANEDREGEPFVGDAGKLLDAILAAIGLARGNNVFIANVLKSRPPGNRDPKPEEVATCLPFLERQIELIQPKLIVALGRFAAQSLLATDTPIGRLRGQVHQYRGVPLVVTYHPAYLLRNPLDKAKVWEDLVLARDTMQALKQ